MLGNTETLVGVLITLIVLCIVKGSGNFFRELIKTIPDKIKKDIDDRSEKMQKRFDDDLESKGEYFVKNLSEKLIGDIRKKITGKSSNNNEVIKEMAVDLEELNKIKADTSYKITQLKNEFFIGATEIFGKDQSAVDIMKTIEGNDDDLNIQSYLLFISVSILLLDCWVGVGVKASILLCGVICFMSLYAVTHWLSFVKGIRSKSFITKEANNEEKRSINKFFEILILFFLPIILLSLLLIFLGMYSVHICLYILVCVLVLWMLLYYIFLRCNIKRMTVNYAFSFAYAVYSVGLSYVFGVVAEHFAAGDCLSLGGLDFFDKWKDMFIDNVDIIIKSCCLQNIFATVLSVVSLFMPAFIIFLYIVIYVRIIANLKLSKLYKMKIGEARNVLGLKNESPVCRWFDKLKKRFCHKD